MKLRETSYPTAYGGVARSGAAPAQALTGTTPTGPAPTGAANGAAASGDVATIMGIPEVELTPRVRNAIDQLMAEVQRLREELELANKRLSHVETLADQDSLTPVLNRRAFVRELSRMMAFAERYQAPGSVIYFDIDGLKEVNDSLGHSAGDAVIGHLAEVLVRNIRASDIVGRLGGDEFGVILTQTKREAAQDKANYLAEAIQGEPARWNGTQMKVRVSFGVHTFSGDEAVDDALHAADQAMYVHKNDGTLTPADD